MDKSVIFENGLWRRDYRDEKRREAREFGVDIELHYFDVPVEELVRRLEIRNAERNLNACPVSRDEIEDYFGSVQPPDDAELGPFAGSIVHRHLESFG
jgi:predicted kinase